MLSIKVMALCFVVLGVMAAGSARAANPVVLVETSMGNFKIELFMIRVGDWGGYMLLDCDDPTSIHKFCSMLPAFVFEARPVISIDDAVRVELEAIAFRDGLKRN